MLFNGFGIISILLSMQWVHTKPLNSLLIELDFDSSTRIISPHLIVLAATACLPFCKVKKFKKDTFEIT